MPGACSRWPCDGVARPGARLGTCQLSVRRDGRIPCQKPRRARGAQEYTEATQPTGPVTGSAPNLTAIGPPLPVPPRLVRLARGRGQGNIARAAWNWNGTFPAASLPFVVCFILYLRPIGCILRLRPVFSSSFVLTSEGQRGVCTEPGARYDEFSITNRQKNLREESKCMCPVGVIS